LGYDKPALIQYFHLYAEIQWSNLTFLAHSTKSSPPPPPRETSRRR
jgi:hypothetical protein